MKSVWPMACERHTLYQDWKVSTMGTIRSKSLSLSEKAGAL